ncbi:MAG: MFS transporter [Candidatus Caldarchaeum sp.]
MHIDQRWILLSWLFLDRIVYTLNWLAISPAQPFVAYEFGLGLTSLGFLGTIFLIGIGVFQLPAAVLATKYGARKIALIGLLMSSLFAGLCGLAPNFETLLVFRFLTGVFLSFFFGPGIMFFTPLFGTKERGFALGIYNAGFHMGTLIAIGFWPMVISLVGWRNGLLIPGILGILLTASTYRASLWVHEPPSSSDFGLSTAKNSVVLASALGLGVAGAAWYPLTQFGIFYLNSEKNLGFETAGLLISILSVGSVVGAPVIGRIFDLTSSRKRLLYVLSLMSAFSLFLFAFSPVLLIPAVMFSVGFFYTGLNSLLYVAPLTVLSENKVAVAVATVNCVHLIAASTIPYIFANVVETQGYLWGWAAMSALCLTAAIFIKALKL